MKKKEMHRINFGREYISSNICENFRSVLGITGYTEKLSYHAIKYLKLTTESVSLFYDHDSKPILPAIYETHTKDAVVRLCKEYNDYMAFFCVVDQHMSKDELLDAIERVGTIFKCAYPINQRPAIFDDLWIELLKTVNSIMREWITDGRDESLHERLRKFSMFLSAENLNDTIASWDKLCAAINTAVRSSDDIISYIQPISGVMRCELLPSVIDEMAELIVKTYIMQMQKFSIDTAASNKENEKSVVNTASGDLAKDINIGENVWRNDDRGFDDCE